jgi:hypothetical protein
MQTGDCEHCNPVVIYESERFKTDEALIRKVLKLYGDTKNYQALEEHPKTVLERHEVDKP